MYAFFRHTRQPVSRKYKETVQRFFSVGECSICQSETESAAAPFEGFLFGAVRIPRRHDDVLAGARERIGDKGAVIGHILHFEARVLIPALHRPGRVVVAEEPQAVVLAGFVFAVHEAGEEKCQYNPFHVGMSVAYHKNIGYI